MIHVNLKAEFVQNHKKEKKYKKIKKTLAKCATICYYINRSEYPGVAQLGARLTGGQEAVSSSLATRTILSIHKGFDL